MSTWTTWSCCFFSICHSWGGRPNCLGLFGCGDRFLRLFLVQLVHRGAGFRPRVRLGRWARRGGACRAGRGGDGPEAQGGGEVQSSHQPTVQLTGTVMNLCQLTGFLWPNFPHQLMRHADVAGGHLPLLHGKGKLAKGTHEMPWFQQHPSGFLPGPRSF